MTPLERRLRESIALEGPITVERYMGLCLQHYYANRDPLGTAGDFTTSPEISQMFGELLGLWSVAVWSEMGRPAVNLVELGPGRGTLMADALRAARLTPDFLAGLAVHLVETSPALREAQRRTLASSGARIQWHDRIEDVPAGPSIVLANEFFDALPVRQFIATESGWCERLVGLSEDRLAFGLRAEPETSLASPPRPSEVLEVPGTAIVAMRQIARLLQSGGAMLIVDYGYWGPTFGDTLQAVRNHAFVDVLADPGEADLTTHVDFHRLAETAAGMGLRVHGPAMQGAFLQALGIEPRAAALKQRATPAQAEAIDRARERLTGKGRDQMGELFKVLAVSHSSIETVPGLAPRRGGTDRNVHRST